MSLKVAGNPERSWWKDLHHDSFPRRSFRHWLFSGTVLTPKEEEAEEMKGIDLRAYQFKEEFIRATQQHSAVLS